jgi:hypothetical protein
LPSALQGFLCSRSLFPLVCLCLCQCLWSQYVQPENKTSHPKWRTSTQSPPWKLVKCAGTLFVAHLITITAVDVSQMCRYSECTSQAIEGNLYFPRNFFLH